MSIAPTQRWVCFAFVLGATVLGTASVQAQGLPGGSYQRTCKQIHWAGTTLVGECLTADGRYTGTGLPNAHKCAGDIGNNNGRLQCTYAGGALSPGASPVPQGQPAPAQGYGQPGYGYGQPGYGYSQPGYGYGQPSGPGYGYSPPPGSGYGPPPDSSYPPPSGYPPPPGYGYGPR
jgi:hypothetical protein